MQTRKIYQEYYLLLAVKFERFIMGGCRLKLFQNLSILLTSIFLLACSLTLVPLNISYAQIPGGGLSGQHAEGIRKNSGDPEPPCTFGVPTPGYEAGKCQGSGCLVVQYRCCGNGRVEYSDSSFWVQQETCDSGANNGKPEGAGCRTDCSKCGDGFIQSVHSEVCDPGSGPSTAKFTTEYDQYEIKSCDSSCQVHFCGDGTPDQGSEECDEGGNNGEPNSGCTDDCKKTSKCPNNIVEIGETCEPGLDLYIPNVPAPRYCDSECHAHYCGDGVRDVSIEECDLAGNNGVFNQGCSIDCKITPVCGNRKVELGETCDLDVFVPDVPSPRSCDGVCQAHYCGDKVEDTANGEECDLGSENGQANKGCTTDCKKSPICLNGIFEGSETCEQSLASSETIYLNDYPLPRSCLNCEAIYCGDGTKNQTAEDCDAGPNNGAPTSGCSLSCKSVPICGDGKVEGTETCDLDKYVPDVPTPRSCEACQAKYCGDGVKNQTVEDCDEGSANGSPTSNCSASCKFVDDCPNGEIDPGEDCDLPDLGPDGGRHLFSCDANCQSHYCGDGTLDAGEDCDGLNFAPQFGSLPLKVCTSTCEVTYCGDGDVNGPDELCDDGDTLNTDECSNTCTSAICGDGIVQNFDGHIELCDDGNPVDGDGCSNSCEGVCMYYTVSFSVEYNYCAWDQNTGAGSGSSVVVGAPGCLAAGPERQYNAFGDDAYAQSLEGRFGSGGLAAAGDAIWESYKSSVQGSTTNPTSGDPASSSTVTTVGMDVNCNPVSIPSDGVICGAVDIGYRVSPISLDFGGQESWRVVQFKLSPHQEQPWVVWKGSADRPLLVYDPEHRGLVSTGKDLFGNWTFGGRTGLTQAGLQASGAPVHLWSNGYEALAELDLDRNGLVSGDELQPLALWFDRNQNAISEMGEVVPLTETGVTELKTKFTVVDQFSGLTLSKNGYTRTSPEGETSQGDSYDWFTGTYSSKSEALAELRRVGLNYPEIKIPRDPKTVKSKPKFTPKKSTSVIDGLWFWQADGDDKTTGVLLLENQDGKVNGASVVEQFVKPNRSGLRTYLTLLRATGTSAEVEGKLNLEIEVFASGVKTTSEISYDATKDRLIGKSSAEKDGNTIEYTWTARRIVYDRD